MAMLGFPLYVSILLCLTVEIYSDLAIISAIAELKDRMDDLAEKTSVIERQLNKSIDSINLKIDRLGHFSNEEGDVVKTNERVIKALISEKGFVTKSLSVYEGRFKDFQKIIVEQMTVLNSTIVASHDNLERKLAENNLSMCPIPFDTDRRVSVYEWWSSSRVDLSEGDTIRNQEYVMFNCSNVIEQKYEPANRRFQCVRGQWMEADRNPNWTLGNNGDFPECREAICDPPCENGGVCFKDGLCRCEHMTTGDRCQTVLCHESCTRNGGECIKPGTCGNCPETRLGDNCEVEKSDFKYVVRIQVGDMMNAGTDDNIEVRIYGHEEHTAAFRINGGCGRNQFVEYEFRGIYVGPIQTVVVSKGKGRVDDELLILYVSIFIEDSDDYYVFTYRDQPHVWLTASKPLEMSISQHPEHCIHTYGEAMYRSPKGGNCGKHIGYMSLRECKQRCVTTRSILCNSILFIPRASDRQWISYCFHYTNSPDSNYFRDNTRDETRRQRVSYKRICREP